MLIKQRYISKDKYPKKATYPMNAEFYVIHNTYNDAPAINEAKYMESNNNATSFHVVIDDKEVLELIPENRNSWAEGDGTNGRGNRKGVSIEIAYSKSGGVRFDKAEANAAKYVATRLKSRGWGIDRVKKHQDFSGKYCPHRTLDKGWQRFLNMVQAEMGGSTVSKIEWYAIDKKDNDKQGVIQLQKDLVKLGFGVGSYGANGIFGNDTKSAVEKFQKANGLSADGSAGPATLAKIKELLSKPVAPTNDLAKVQAELKTANDKLKRIKDIL